VISDRLIVLVLLTLVGVLNVAGFFADLLDETHGNCFARLRINKLVLNG